MSSLILLPPNTLIRLGAVGADHKVSVDVKDGFPQKLSIDQVLCDAIDFRPRGFAFDGTIELSVGYQG